MKKFLLSEGDRNELRRLLSAARSAPAPTVLRDVSRKTFFEGDTYWALPPCETGLPAAEFVGDQWTSYGIKCCLFKKDAFTNKMEPLLDAVGNPIRVEVWNHYGTSEMNLVQVHKHKEGFWTNERPLGATANTAVNQSTTSGPIIPQCAGKCVWTADANGVWQWPTGGCTASSTTSTTTGAPTTGAPGAGSTAPPLGIPTTPAPCQAAPPCFLVCIDTSTTPAPDEYGVPVPYTRFRYAMKVGSSCPAGCKCYGLGDPCFLVAGELKSSCIGDTAATSTTTAAPGSTPPPEAYPCVEATFIFGTVPPNIRRIAYKINGDVEPCQECSDPKADFYSPGAVPYRQHDWRKLSTVYESPCVDSPCVLAPDSEGLPMFTAFAYTDQVNVWGAANNPAVYDNTPGLPAPRYLANWFNCEVTLRNRRPNRTPPLWIYDVDDSVSTLNTARGITFENGVYVFRTIWAEGLACGNCGRGPTLLEKDRVSVEPGGSTTSTTTSTTTTLGPCGCVRPNYCPLPFECTLTACVRGGEVVNGTPGTTRSPVVPCFPDSPPTSTTNGPNQCIDSRGKRCVCGTGTTTTSNPGGNLQDPRCPNGFYYGYPPNDLTGCAPGQCYPISTVPPIDAQKCWAVNCRGSCGWLGQYTNARGGIHPPDRAGLAWVRFYEPLGGTLTGDLRTIGCTTDVQCEDGGFYPNMGCSILGSYPGCFQCQCIPPAEPPATCGQITYTGCRGQDYRECACCTPTTTGSPCGVRTCRYRANSALNWVLVTNSCILNCPCPNPAGLPRPVEECESLTLTCGQTLPPPTTSPPTTINPCRCGAQNCGCSTGGIVYCPPGTVFNCINCLCQTTTSAPTTSTSAPTTTFTPCGGANCGATNCGCTGGYTWYCNGIGEVYDCSVCGCVTTTTSGPVTTNLVTSSLPP